MASLHKPISTPKVSYLLQSQMTLTALEPVMKDSRHIRSALAIKEYCYEDIMKNRNRFCDTVDEKHFSYKDFCICEDNANNTRCYGYFYHGFQTQAHIPNRYEGHITRQVV